MSTVFFNNAQQCVALYVAVLRDTAHYVAMTEHDPQQQYIENFCGMSYEPGKPLHQPPWTMRPALRLVEVDVVAIVDTYLFHIFLISGL